VAVLPFDNLSEHQHRYFSDGITEDIITSLSRFGSLIIIARNSSFAYRDSDRSLEQIGRELRAQFLLQGSVQREGSRVRINVQLLEADSARHVWAHRFDRKMESLFVLQDEVTETVVSTLAGRVEAARLAQTRRIPADRLLAYDLLLRGKDQHHAYTAEANVRAIETLERAIECDPDYAPAHAWLACVLGQAFAFRPNETATLLEQAHASANRGLQLDPDEAECHRILAQVFLLKRDHARSLSHSERALELNPNDDRAVCGHGEILAYCGRAAEAEHWVRKAMRLNPYHPDSYWFHLGRALFHSGRDQEAVDAYRRITSPQPRHLALRAAAALRCGNADEQRQAVEALHSDVPDFDADRCVQALPYPEGAARAELLEALERAGVDRSG